MIDPRETNEHPDAPVAGPRGSADLSTFEGEKLWRSAPPEPTDLPLDAVYSIACGVCVMLVQIGVGMYIHFRAVENVEVRGERALALAVVVLLAVALSLGGVIVAVVSWIKRPDRPRWAIAGIAFNIVAFFADGITRAVLATL